MMLHIEVCTDISGELPAISFLNMKDNYSINKTCFDNNCLQKFNSESVENCGAVISTGCKIKCLR
jgi:hypothetical protein